ncbi:hypothetical protein NX059_011384 [Plenodomus lindquistii]|nr:hypothetical protein NX059_011384 [Plenodomus lindquistii]
MCTLYDCNLVMTHDAKTRCTFTVLYMRNSHILSDITSKILSSELYASQFSFVPLLLLRERISFLSLNQGDIFHDFDAIQAALGCRHQSLVFSVAEEDLEKPDVTNMPRGLTSLACFLGHQARALVYCAEEIRSVQSLVDAHTHSTDDVLTEMTHQLQYIDQQCRQFSLETQEWKELVQAMVQMVYAILQQRDNEINHRYGADMRVITAITLVFLPGTFIATLFSTSFWNFAPNNSGPKVSGWVWLYFVVTAILTLVVLSVWRGFTVLKQFKKTLSQFWQENVLVAKIRRVKRGPSDVELGSKAE